MLRAMVISQLSLKNMLLQLCVGALRVAFERREPPNSSMERGHVLGPRQIMHFVENLQAFNFDLAQALIHRTHAGVVSEWVVVRRSGGCIDRHRGQAVAKRVQPRTRLALWTAGGRGLLRRCACSPRSAVATPWPYFRDANTAASCSAMAFSAAKRSARALAFEVLSRSSRNTSRRFCADTIRR